MIFKLMFIFVMFSMDALSFERPKGIDIAKDRAEFYPAYMKVIYVRNFQLSSVEIEKFKTKIKRIVRIPTSIIEERLGFKKGIKFRAADFDELTSYEYTLKDYSYLLLFDELPEGNPKFNASLVLSDDSQVHQTLSTKFREWHIMNGLAYTGSSRNLNSNMSIQWFPVSEVPKNDPVFKNQHLGIAKDSKLKVAKIYNYEVIINTRNNLSSEALNTFYFRKKDGAIVGFPRDSEILDPTRGMKVYDWIEGVKIFRMFNYGGEGYEIRSEYLIFCSPEKLELLQLL